MKIDQVVFDAAMTGDDPVERPQDCQRICNVAAEVFGINMRHQQADEIWSAWSEMFAAGWLFLPDDDEDIKAEIRRYVLTRLGIKD